jgi:hypothetical protein
MSLKLQPNIFRPDDIYAALLAAHEGLSVEESMRFNFRLILLLMNQIGDAGAICEALRVASSSAAPHDDGKRS